jgi:HK97 family phage portal protein
VTVIRRLLTGNEGAPGEARTTFADVWGRNSSDYGSNNSSGTNINADTAMQITAVFACVRILSDNVSTLPLDTFVSSGETRRPFPAPQWMSFQLGGVGKIDIISQMVVSILLNGDAFVAIRRDGQFRVISLEVLNPADVTVHRVSGDTVYRINGGGSDLTRLDILHVPGMMMPGALTGMSPVEYARESLGLSAAATQYGAAFFGGGALPGMTVEVPGEMSNVGIKALKRAWNDVHQGAGNSHKLAVLTEGAKFTKVSVNPDDAQFLQTRQFQVPDVARIYGVPPHLIGDATGSTSWGSGLAEQNSSFVQHTLRPLVERIESGFNWLLHSEGLPADAFVKLTLDGMLRGSNKDRLESYVAGIEAGFYTIDEVRAWENLPPLPMSTKPQKVVNNEA